MSALGLHKVIPRAFRASPGTVRAVRHFVLPPSVSDRASWGERTLYLSRGARSDYRKEYRRVRRKGRSKQASRARAMFVATRTVQ